MPSNRIGRINEEIQRELSDLLRNVKDPRVAKTMISVTRVDTTNDLRYAKVFVSVYDKNLSKEVFKGLKSCGGYLRHELAARLSLRYTPELVWEEDHSITYGARILDILSTLDIPKDDQDNAGAAIGRQPGADASDEGAGNDPVLLSEATPEGRALCKNPSPAAEDSET